MSQMTQAKKVRMRSMISSPQRSAQGPCTLMEPPAEGTSELSSCSCCLYQCHALQSSQSTSKHLTSIIPDCTTVK